VICLGFRISDFDFLYIKSSFNISDDLLATRKDCIELKLIPFFRLLFEKNIDRLGDDRENVVVEI